MILNHYSAETLEHYSRKIIALDNRLEKITALYGFPPFWHRDPGFECLIRIILEQQVSLASAYAAFSQLKNRIDPITPEKILELSDLELKQCHFSRQKSAYVKNLANEIISGNLNLAQLIEDSDESIRKRLTKIKGIGDWTVDIFLLLSLHRLDIFPLGDLAVINSLKSLGLVEQNSKEHIIQSVENFRPFRSILAVLAWHYYIKSKNLKIPDV